jgi:hypothetical protein
MISAQQYERLVDALIPVKAPAQVGHTRRNSDPRVGRQPPSWAQILQQHANPRGIGVAFNAQLRLAQFDMDSLTAEMDTSPTSIGCANRASERTERPEGDGKIFSSFGFVPHLTKAAQSRETMTSLYKSENGARLVQQRYADFLRRWPVANRQFTSRSAKATPSSCVR